MTDSQQNCPLCEFENCVEQNQTRRTFRIACPACGDYSITFEALDEVRAADLSLKPLLSIATRRRTESKAEPVLLQSGNWRVYAEEFRGVSVGTKLRNLLEVLRKRSDVFGQYVEFEAQRDWPIIEAKSPQEAVAILDAATKQKLVVNDHRQTQHSSMSQLTWDGWQQVEPIAGGVPGLGFVAMAFTPELDEAFQLGIVPACEDCGFHAVRTDKEHFEEKICDQIIVEIRRAQFVIADFTRGSRGVYFEAGYALALGRIVIWTCHEGDKENLHFDTRQYPHILWRDPEDLREQLRDRLRALVPNARLR